MAADDDDAREDVHEPGDPIAPDDEVAAAIVARFEGAVFDRSHGQPVVYVDRSVFAGPLKLRPSLPVALPR